MLPKLSEMIAPCDAVGTAPPDQVASVQFPPAPFVQRAPASFDAISTAARAWISPAPVSFCVLVSGMADCVSTDVICAGVSMNPAFTAADCARAATAPALGAAAEVPLKGAKDALTDVLVPWAAEKFGSLVLIGVLSVLPLLSNNKLPVPTDVKPVGVGGETPKAGVCA
jgi:hypothetical protein